ncbi:hypothetical protein [Chitinibacter sp. S2-10]|uniref:hypothetical protein n=1 Tax=Chitinibacter sp. S2-10 TaxID=3373597 RepID=UPI0039779079
MINNQHEPRVLFSRLRLRYQIILLWLPLTVSALFIGFGGYYLGVELAGFFNINPSAPIVSQPSSGIFFCLWMVLFVFLAALGWVISYLILIMILKFIKDFENSMVKAVLLGKNYPKHWLQKELEK